MNCEIILSLTFKVVMHSIKVSLCVFGCSIVIFLTILQVWSAKTNTVIEFVGWRPGSFKFKLISARFNCFTKLLDCWKLITRIFISLWSFDGLIRLPCTFGCGLSKLPFFSEPTKQLYVAVQKEVCWQLYWLGPLLYKIFQTIGSLAIVRWGAINIW